MLLDGVFTHLAVADELSNPYTDHQLQRFTTAVAGLADVDGLSLHAANSAAALTRPDARHSAVRAGIAVYGVSPGPELDEMTAALRPALTLKARVSFVKRLAPGDRVSYGLRHVIELGGMGGDRADRVRRRRPQEPVGDWAAACSSAGAVARSSARSRWTS